MRKNIISVSSIAPISIAGIIMLTGTILLSNKVSADGVVDEINITVPMSCTMSGTGMDTHNANINNGTYTPNIGTTTMHVFCNDNEGFAIYAAGYTEDEIGGTNSNKLVGTSASGNAVIESGLATSAGNPDTSNWAMKLAITQDSGDTTGTNAFAIDSAPNTSGGSDASFGEYHVVPNEYTKAAHKNSGTDMTASTGGVKLTTTYAAYISKTQPADTYTGQVIYTLVHPSIAPAPFVPHEIECEAGKVCYNTNAAPTETEGTMGQQVLSSIDKKDWSYCSYISYIDDVKSCYDSEYNTISIEAIPNNNYYTSTLLASNYSRNGYGFAGWSDRYDYATNSNAHFYGPQETITIPEDVEEDGLSLYAIWVKSEGNIQDTAKVAQVCSSLTQSGSNVAKTLNSVSALTDVRDNETYAIAKLADGKCWMIENLRLSDVHQEGSSSVATTLTTTNTNNPLNDGTNVTLKHNYADTQTFTNLSPTSSVAYDASTAPEGWCIDSNASCYNQSRIRTDNTTNRTTSSPNTNSNPMYSYGNYYNWYSATAGRGTYSKSSGEVAGDLCPSGWKLPRGKDSGNGNIPGGFYYLFYKLNNDSSVINSASIEKLRAYPNNYLYSGNVYSRGLSNLGNAGYYWSSTAGSNYLVYYLYLSSAGSSPGAYLNSKFYGATVRCVASNQ